jgi:hypothetical protein
MSLSPKLKCEYREEYEQNIAKITFVLKRK